MAKLIVTETMTGASFSSPEREKEAPVGIAG